MAPIPPTTRRRALASFLALAPLAACAELSRPSHAWSLPPGLLPASLEPGRAAIGTLAQDLQGANSGLSGQPARVARAAALLEWLAVELMSNPRWAPIPRELRAAIGLARDEMRGALGADPLAASPRLAAALASAHRALAAGSRGAAEQVLAASLFPRGGAATLGRLGDPGPLPQGEIASAALAERVRLLDETNGWAADFNTPVPPERGGRGALPFGI
ncbi:hypothetical protein J8J14_18700 [Roseomonas sp. SSH11]|uniref:Uncharacterized protein n=1 Tax=Pararoseomonas baculiformis TaxID=2820812 RepID=A0ABS4AIX4_9PROT|nr:hypothetical protein [Pararoseomonas baculiformis]MBP0446809.1 hypothetical protein [Pararoseomonas baculiformis]